MFQNDLCNEPVTTLWNGELFMVGAPRAVFFADKCTA